MTQSRIDLTIGASMKGFRMSLDVESVEVVKDLIGGIVSDRSINIEVSRENPREELTLGIGSEERREFDATICWDIKQKSAYALYFECALGEG